MSGYRPPYTIEEEKKILRYIIKNELYVSLKGDRMWKVLERDKEAKINRTWQSLKQHFRKKIINDLNFPEYDLSKLEIEKIYTGFYKTAPTKNFTPMVTDKTREVPNFLDSSASDSESA